MAIWPGVQGFCKVICVQFKVNFLEKNSAEIGGDEKGGLTEKQRSS